MWPRLWPTKRSLKLPTSKSPPSLLAPNIGPTSGCKRPNHPFPFWSIGNWRRTGRMVWKALCCAPGVRAICFITPGRSGKGGKRWAIGAIRISWAAILWWEETAVSCLPTPAATRWIGRLWTNSCKLFLHSRGFQSAFLRGKKPRLR